MTNQQALETIQVQKQFSRDCVAIGEKVILDIDKIHSVVLADDKEQTMLIKEGLFLKQSINLFNKRSSFLLSTIDEENVESARSLIRGLIEIICKALYLCKAPPEEKTKAIIWMELYSFALIGKERAESVELCKLNYLNLAKLGVSDFPSYPDLVTIVQSAVNLNENKKLRALENKYGFPGVRSILKTQDILPGITPITPKSLYYFYSVYSLQVHSNPYLENGSSPRSKYGILGILLLLQMKFLEIISHKIQFHEEKVEMLVKRWKESSAAYIVDWSNTPTE